MRVDSDAQAAKVASALPACRRSPAKMRAAIAGASAADGKYPLQAAALRKVLQALTNCGREGGAASLAQRRTAARRVPSRP